MEQRFTPQIVRVSSTNMWVMIFFTGLLAGTLDAIAAIIVYQANPSTMFKFIASGVFGAGKAFSGDGIMVFWGVLFHYIISFSWTTLFFLIFPWVFRIANKYITGILYGIFIWTVMNYAVLPLSAISQKPPHLKAAIIGALILIFAVSMPIVFLAHRYYARKGTV